MKEKNVKRILALFLAGVMAATAGCGSGTSDTESTADGKEKTEVSADGEKEGQGGADGAETEKFVLQVFIDEDVTWNGDAAVIKKIEEDFNVELEPISRPSMNQSDWYTLKFASGEAESFDYITSGGLGFARFDQYVDEEIIIPISQEMIEENMPNLMNWMEKYQYLWDGDLFSYYYRNDQLYAIPQARPDDAVRNVLGFRQDWLDKLGLEVPQTLDEMTEVLRAFVERDPDGNGIDDTYGFTGTNWIAYSLSPFFATEGIYTDCYYEKDGEFVFGKTDAEGMKKVLQVLADWYAEGLLDPEILVQSDFAEVKNKVCSSQVGSTIMYYGDFIFPDDGWYYTDLLAINPDAKWTITGGVDGNGVLQFNPVAYAGVMFTEHMQDEPEKMKRYMQVFDALMAPEYQVLLNWGIEGETYEVDANGDRQWLPPYDTQTDEQTMQELGEKYGIGTYGCAISAFTFISEWWSDPEQIGTIVYNADKAELNQMGMETATGVYDIMSPYNSLNEARTQYNTALSTLYSSYISDIITGARPVSDYDQFLEEFYEQGGTQILEEAQELYNQYFSNR